MSPGFLTIAFLLLIVPGLSRGAIRRLSPDVWVRLAVVAVASGLVLMEAGLVFAAVPTVMRPLGLTGLADLCQRAAGHLFPGGATTGWLAAAAAVALPTAVASGALAAGRSHQKLCDHATVGRVVDSAHGYLIIEVPTDQQLAVAARGRPGCVIVTSGVLSVLSEDERSAVIEHEIAHLRRSHWRWLAVVAGARRAFGWFYPVRRSLQLLRLGIERVADEDAAAGNPLVRSAIRRALVKLSTGSNPSSVMAFSLPDQVIERVRALEKPVPTSSVLTLAGHLVLGSLLVAAAVTLGLWIGHTHQLAMLGAICPV